MSIIGNPIMISGSGGGGGNNTLVASIWGTINSATYKTVGTGGLTVHSEDSDFFTYSDGEFTCATPGTFDFQIFAKGGYNSSGGSIYTHYQLIRESGGIATTLASFTGNLGITGRIETVTAALLSGDKVYLQLNTTNAWNMDGGVVISTN